MSDCTNGELRDLLPELMHGMLDAEARKRVEAHVAACPTCATELALLTSLRATLAPGPRVDVQRIAAAVAARTMTVSRGGVHARHTPWRIAIAAAALVAASGAGYAVFMRGRISAPAVVVAHTRDSTAGHDSQPAAAPLPTPRQEVAVAPPHAAPTLLASAGALDNLSDLSDDDVRALSASLDGLSAVPDADPAPEIDPLGVSYDDPFDGDLR